MAIDIAAMADRKDKILAKLTGAIKDNDETGVASAMEQWQSFVSEQITAEAKGIVSASDKSILSARGCRQLTSKETDYYNQVIAAAKSLDPKGAITNLDIAFPETITDSVMEDISSAHPLLSAIDLQNTTILTKWIYNKQGAQKAVWGEINSEIEKELQGEIGEINLGMYKLSAFMYIPLDMLDLGPEWIDRYIRAILTDAFAAGLESGVISGNGKTTPIGMMCEVGDDVTVTGGVYPTKKAKTITDLSPATYGALLSELAKSPTGKARTVEDVILVVNPFDYFKLVMPATTMQLPTGGYANNVLPYPTNIIQSAEVPEGKAILGMGKRYFMGVGTGANGKLEYSDDFQFLNDKRTYKIKGHANGRPKDNNSFILLDISGLEPAFYNVKTKSTANSASNDNSTAESTTKSS